MKAIKYIGAMTLFMLALTFSSGVKGQGIDFFHGSFAEAQVKAKKENKLIFMDAYTSWCGPCKWMAANVFTNADVGTFFNKNFINMKVDMEKGEGRTLQRKYRVMAYPTLLFIDGGGTVQERTMGAKQVQAFINLGKKAVGKKPSQL